MYLHKFSEDDLLFNIINTRPQVSFKIFAGKVWDSEYRDDTTLSICGSGEGIADFNCKDNSYNIAVVL